MPKLRESFSGKEKVKHRCTSRYQLVSPKSWEALRERSARRRSRGETRSGKWGKTLGASIWIEFESSDCWPSSFCASSLAMAADRSSRLSGLDKNPFARQDRTIASIESSSRLLMTSTGTCESGLQVHLGLREPDQVRYGLACRCQSRQDQDAACESPRALDRIARFNGLEPKLVQPPFHLQSICTYVIHDDTRTCARRLRSTEIHGSELPEGAESRNETATFEPNL